MAARFALGERLKGDRLGRVFRALDLENGGAPVTYRVIDPALTALPASWSELAAQFTAVCAHPHRNLVNVLAFAFTDQGHIVVTELIEGFTLLDLLKHRGALPPHEVLLLLAPLASAADHAAAYRLRGFSLGKEKTWVHFPNAASVKSRRNAPGESVSAWPPHELKAEVISPDAPSGGNADAVQSMATLATSGKGFRLTQRTASAALAHLACELLGGASGAFTPIARLSEAANAILRRACTEPAAYSTAGAFLQALAPALGKGPTPSPARPCSAQPRQAPSSSPALAAPHASKRALSIAASLLLLLVAGLAFYYYGIHAPRERERENRAIPAKAPTIRPLPTLPVKK